MLCNQSGKLIALASVKRCWCLSRSAGSGMSPPLWARGRWSSTLTLLDSIMPVLAWNLTVFNLARSFFSTLGKKKDKTKSLGFGCFYWSVLWHFEGNKNTNGGSGGIYLFLLGMTPICSLSPCGVTSLACHHSSSEALMTWRISPYEKLRPWLGRQLSRARS